MRIKLFSGFEPQGRDEPLVAGPRWKDLQAGSRVVCTADGQPIRLIPPRSRLPVGRYNSRKAGRMLHHQSRGHGHVGGEKLALMINEIDPAVVDFRSQHIRFDLLVDGAARCYFPDILSLMHDGTIAVIEVKKDMRALSAPDYAAKIDEVRAVCSDLGWRFEVWTERDMAPCPRVRDNIRQIQMERFVSIDDVQVLLVRRAFHEHGGRLSVGQIKRVLGGAPGAMGLVAGLMCRGLLGLPLGERISDETIATYFVRSTSPAREHAA